MDNFKYPAIAANRKTGSESINGIESTHLLDFWQWAYSDLMYNAERGIFAEWLVSRALGAADGIRKEWDKYDILTNEGYRIEVKTSGYLQSWNQKELSKIIFGVNRTFAWNKDTNTYDVERKRQSDVYVFCVHKHTEQATVNPLDIEQWEFYILSTEILNFKIKDQKTISLSKLIEIGASKTEYNNLKSKIDEIMSV